MQIIHIFVQFPKNHDKPVQVLTARLEAEQALVPGIRFPESLTARRDQPQVIKILDAETALFESRRQSIEGRIRIFHKRIDQLKKEISGLQAQATCNANRFPSTETISAKSASAIPFASA